MGQISTLFAHKVIDAATVGSGGDQNWRRALFRSVGLDPEAAVDPKRMIDDETYYGLCERVTDRDPDPGSVSIRVGSLMRCDDYGAFGLA
ncbi:MAG: AraC family transcriptional regulator, partial [Pseudomonadota bacterium]